MDKRPDHATIQELTTELNAIKDNLRDLEDMHAFTFGQTSVHISAEKVQNLQLEFEKERTIYRRQITEIEEKLEAGGEAQ